MSNDVEHKEYTERTSFSASVAIEEKIGDIARTNLYPTRVHAETIEDAVKHIVSEFSGEKITAITLTHVFFNVTRFYNRAAIDEII